ncbi:MAG: HD-GYP domain-containing protein (c-di-GMP phosphodiesterase class II) [Kiritimatiellia bacterium]|jgi:HD-GYP domain-containing protein (c-di-GMP phosphodiesterase class II)
MNTSIKLISIDQLQMGMFITEGNSEWVPNKNCSRKGMVNRAEVIEQIRALGVKELYIDASRGKDVQPAKATKDKPGQLPDSAGALNAVTKTSTPLPTPKVPLAKEIENAKAMQSEATELISRCMSDIKMGTALELAEFTDISGRMIESLSQNYNALAYVTQLRQKDRYLMEHSFNVSVLMGILAHALGYSGETLQEMVAGALLHDVGKIRIADEILHKPGKLLPEEWEEMKMHVTYGEEVLQNTPSITAIMLDICAQHHERIDGGGYPRGLSGDEIPIHSRMAAVVDVYDAITAERVYHKGMAPTLALKKLMEWSTEGHLDPQLVRHFIHAMGVYPVGCVVELDKQKLAVVLEANPVEPKKPKVIQMYDLNIRRYVNKLAINLADERCGRHIVKAVYAESYGITLGDFI